MSRFQTAEERNSDISTLGAEVPAGAESSAGDSTSLPIPSKAARLSLLPGLGQIYNGQKIKGILFLVVTAANLLVLSFIFFGGPILWVLSQISGFFGSKVNSDLFKPIQDVPAVGAFTIIYLGLITSFAAFAVRDAYDHAATAQKRQRRPKQSVGLSETVSGSYLFHYAIMACCLILVLFIVAPKPPQEQATNIELVPEPPPPAPKHKQEAKPQPPKPVVQPPKPVTPPTPPKPVTPQPIAVKSDQPAPDMVPVAPAPPPAPAAAPSSGSSSGSTDSTGQGQDVDFGPYMSEMQRRIKKAWFPPKGNETKRVSVKFTIHRNGTISDLRLDKSSGVTVSDDAALQSVSTAAPFAPLPAGAPDEIDIRFNFDYNVFNGGGSRFRQF